MKIEIQREHLLQLLQAVVGVVERRQTLAILGNVLLIAEQGRLTLIATDLEVELSASGALDIIEEGRTTLPGRKLFDILRALPDDTTIQLSVDQNKALLKAQHSRFNLATLAAADFPILEDFSADRELRLPQVQLKSLIERTQFAMAQQDVRYYLNGLLLEFNENNLVAVATDGHRLAFCSSEIDNEEGDGSSEQPAQQIPAQQIIVPRKGVQELMRLLTETDSDVLLKVGSTHISAELDSIRCVSKLIDGKFPDYHRAIPLESERVVLVERVPLRSALARTAILAGDNRGVRMQLNGNQLSVQAHNPEQEQAEEDIAVEYSNEPLEIGFNVSYLLDALGSLSGPQVNLFFSDAGSSCLLRAPDEQNCKYVVSPMRL